MDKLLSKYIISEKGLLTPKYFEYKGKLELKLPVVVKPVEGGSTIGISIVKKQSQFEKAVKMAFKYSKRVMVESYIKGREVTVPVFFGKALPIIEIIPKTGFYDYKAKYVKGMSEHILPARLPLKLYKEVQKTALLVHEILSLRDYSRIDFIIDGKGNPYILEANTLPGLTGTSLLPEAAKTSGISFEEMVILMLTGAIRHG
jgi:D-alanine-D-alanine ligase